MHRHRSASCLPRAFPGALLALSVLLCGGSLAEATTAAVLIQQSHDRATQLSRDPEAVASLLACLAEAKDTQKRLGDPHAALPHGARPVAAAPAVLRPRADVRPIPHASPLQPTLIDLPPPAAAL